MKLILTLMCLTIGGVAATNPGHYTKKPTAKQAQDLRDKLSACRIALMQTSIYNGTPIIYHPSDPMASGVKKTKQKAALIQATLEAHGELND